MTACEIQSNDILPNERLTALFEQSLQYAERGWLVFPLWPNRKNPLTKTGLSEGTTDKKIIQAWIEKYPDANIGVVAGARSGVTIIDADVKNGAPGKESLAKLNLPPTLTVKTPTGGWHLYFKYTPLLKTSSSQTTGIDVRNDRSYFVAPPSYLDM